MIEILELNKIYNMDCIDGMRLLDDASVDLTVTSPPYDNLRTYNGYVFDFQETARQLYRITKNGGVVVWVASDATIEGSETGTSFRQALFFKELGFNLHDTMIYQVAGTGAKGSNLAYWQSFEYMFVLSKGKPKAINRLADLPNTAAGKKRSISTKSELVGTRQDRNVIAPEMSIRPNVWYYAVGCNDRTDHPAPFPEQLAHDHIASWSNTGDLVLDPFMGSGTTAKMATLLERKFIGFEISKDYCQMANNRIDMLVRQQTLSDFMVNC